MYALYITNKNYSSWSLRPWILLHQLEIPFEERLVPLVEGSNREQFRKFAPNGRVPCLQDEAITVWDSLAIVEYVAERHERVWPVEPAARAWARSAAAEMHAGFNALRNECGMTCGQRITLRERSPQLRDDLARINELWNDGLDRFGGPFLAGTTYTAADAFYAPVVFRARTYGLEWTGAARAYQEFALTLAGMQSWYRAALQERWREPSHEAELRAYGECTEDLRATPE